MKIPSTVSLIESEAFAHCASLREVDFDDSIECKIGLSAFDDCPSLTRVRLPKLVREVGYYAFGYMISMISGCDIITVPIENFAIEGYKGSEAETYAIENGFTFVSFDDNPMSPTTPTEVTSQCGDVDESGTIELRDAILLNKYLMMNEPISEQGLLNADANTDDTLNVDDGISILRYVVGLVNKLPV